MRDRCLSMFRIGETASLSLELAILVGATLLLSSAVLPRLEVKFVEHLGHYGSIEKEAGVTRLP